LGYALVCAAVLTLYLTGALTFVERKIDEIKFRLLDRPASGDLVLVEIDAQSLAGLGVWPWPRRFHADVVDNLVAAGARRIAFDVDFSAESIPAEDARFAVALAAAARAAPDRKVILPVFREKASSRAVNRQVVDVMPAEAFLPYVDVAHLNFLSSDDGRVRQMENRQIVGSGAFPSLAALLAGEAGTEWPAFAIDFGIDPSTVPRLSFIDVMEGRIPPQFVAGKLVIVGSTAAELGDIIAVPRFANLPGPMLHVLSYESLVQGRALQGLSVGLVAILVVALVIGLGCLCERLSLLRGLLVAVVAAFGVLAASVLVQAAFPVQVDTAPFLLAVLLTFMVTMANRLDQQALRLFFQGVDIRRNDVTMRNLVETSIVGVVICDEVGRIERTNAAAASMFGYAVEELAETSIGRLVPELGRREDDTRVAMRDLAETGHRELWARKADGEVFPIEVTANAFETDGRVNIVAFMNDITLRRKQEEELAFRADHDSLTQLPNRTKFSRLLAAALSDAAASGGKTSVFLLDLDRFKEVNDTLGHAIGDQLLEDVARRLTGLMTGGAVLSRFGGDEFAIFQPRVLDAAQAGAFAARIVDALKQPFDIDEVSLEVGGSIGYAVCPADGETPEILLKRADIAMYNAKRLQSGHARYWAEDDAHSLRNLTLAGDLRRAIEQDELELAFQPKADLSTGTIIGAEVLCRWERAGHGYVSPDEFIGHAEQSGLIYPLTQWVLRNAVEKAAVWRALGWDLNIAVNLSARLLHHEKILALVSDTLEQWAYPPDRLTLEITENALLVNPGHAMIVVSEFAALGVKVSIDDFGTGYSSLSYLTTLKASELKIDKSFVLGMDRDNSFETVVKSVVAMAHDLNLRVVAEGIENEEAVAKLQRFGCDVGQGYLFGKPMDAARFEEFLKNSKTDDRTYDATARRA
jgi:diguanylate cyclase (GGDEF)-like protein/PAS domain S-box-containing protein